jgi:NhaA family Na+:H+ antiporter
VEASSGVVLLAAAAVAMAIANSRFAEAYHHALELPIGVHVGERTIQAPSLHFLVNDGLMTIFFFVVGLEIRREIHEGELSNLRRAALPIVAAVGGMTVPALLYLAAAAGDPADQRGWGVPIATDIAFAVGVLTLLGRRAPPALRVLLLAVAIIDDIGGILVIALFYSGGMKVEGLLAAAGGIAGVLALQRIGVRRPLAYVVPGVIVWLGVLRLGVHPTIAGVALGLLTPAKAWLGPTGLVDVARKAAGRVERGLAEGRPGHIGTEDLAREASDLDVARREALAPATRLQVLLHPWVAFGVMPVFALANAGVTLPPDPLAGVGRVSVGIVLGLVLGKPVGIVGACLLARRFRAQLPRGIGVRELVVLGIVGGIGFTMALFVAGLAFPEGARLDEAKIAILAGSLVAILGGLGAGWALLTNAPREAGAGTVAEAESSDEH